MNPWIQLLGSGGLAAIAVVVVNVLAQRRNLGSQTARTDAEAEDISVNTARGMIAELRAEGDRKDKRIGLLEKRIEGLEQREREQRQVLEIHSAWDFMATSKLRECKPPITFPAPPPLTLPPKREAS